MNTDEREQPTIKTGGESLSIFEIMQRYRNDGSCEYVIQDALRHFALLDSQAAGSDVVSRKEAVARIEKQIRLWANDTVTMACADMLADIKQMPVADAATTMRAACVEKVREMRNSSLWNASGYDGALSNLIDELESVGCRD